MPEPYDRDAYLEALEPPMFVAGGRTHRGVILSADEWIALGKRLERTGESREAQLEAVRVVCDQLFPPLPWWVRWRVREPSVADLVAELPFAGQVEVFKRFLAAQGAIQDGTPPRATTATSGSGSAN